MDIAQNAPETVFMAQDEAGLYLQSTTIAVWYQRGQSPVVRIDPGREKSCFYGSLNLLTGEEIAMQTPLMNGEMTAKHLKQILDAYPDRPILLFWDRAPWHKGAAIRQLLEENPRLELIFFPVASPELNPQEHVWKATRKAISHNHFVPRLAELAKRFEDHLTSNTFASSFLDRFGYNAIRPMFI
jgi:transposase